MRRAKNAASRPRRAPAEPASLQRRSVQTMLIAPQIMSPVLYAALCVVVPLAWGLFVVWVSNRIEALVARRRARSGEPHERLPPTEYHI